MKSQSAELENLTCLRDGCEVVPKKTVGYCSRHHPDNIKAQRRQVIANERADRPLCVFAGCVNRSNLKSADGYCYRHRLQAESGRPLVPVGYHGRQQKGAGVCRFPSCRNKRKSGDYCYTHQEQLDATGKVWDIGPESLTGCRVPGCGRSHRSSRVLCEMHNNRAAQYSIPPHVYLKMVSGGCSICGATDRMAIDHDHRCCNKGNREGKRVSCGSCVRGALCGNCNNMLGHAKSRSNLAKAIKYLESWSPGDEST